MADTVSPTLEQTIAHAEALKATGHAAEAAALYADWIAANDSPSRCVALFNLGVLRSDLGQTEAAGEAYAEAVRLNPRFHQARINAGLIAERQGRDTDAVRQWLGVAEALAAGQPEALPFATLALNHVGRLQEARRNYAAAESALAHSLQLDPQQPDAVQHWVHLRQKQCTWPVFAPPTGLTTNALMAATSPLAMLALLDDPAMQWFSAHRFVSRKYRYPDTRLAPPGGYRHDRLRIGYLSGDLCTHAVGLLMADLLEAHDRTRVQVIAFDFSPEDGTAHRARLKRACDEVVSIHTLSDEAAAQAIQAREVDVLVDMHGLSSGARPGILARRPAPLVAGYLGFIGTSALPWVDLVITDRWTMPESITPYITEQPLYVEGSMIPLSFQPVEAGLVSRATAGLPDDAVVLACFNNIYKLTPSLFARWLRILQRTSNTVLWLLDDNAWATAALRGHATAAGLDPARLVFSGRATHAEYRARLTLADVYLDTYPYNAGSTARDVLDAGVPLVTLSGRTPVTRMAGGLLHAAGLDDLITTTWDDYENLVVALATDPARRQALTARMRAAADGWRAAPARLIRSLEDQLLARVPTAPVPPADPT